MGHQQRDLTQAWACIVQALCSSNNEYLLPTFQVRIMRRVLPPLASLFINEALLTHLQRVELLTHVHLFMWFNVGCHQHCGVILHYDHVPEETLGGQVS